MAESAYKQWRAEKLRNYPSVAEDISVEIAGLNDISIGERAAIAAACKRSNMAIYKCRDKSINTKAVRNFAAQFGLQRIDHHLCANPDGVSELSVEDEGAGLRAGYVPYSNRSLSWHTDGYYKQPQSRIQAVILHCAQTAASGGDNALLDADIAFIKLYDQDPRFITAFEHPQCMTIPANKNAGGDAGGGVRAAVSGPVFWRDRQGRLQMRFSARKRNIQWRTDELTTAARSFLAALLADDEGPVIHYRLRAGEGLISNNVLHNRTAFENSPDNQRLLYRARFFDPIKCTQPENHKRCKQLKLN